MDNGQCVSALLPLSSFLSLTEEGKKKKPVRLAIQRSVETGLAIEMKSRMTRQLSRETAEEGEKPKPGKYEEKKSYIFLHCYLGGKCTFWIKGRKHVAVSHHIR